ncbi:MAG: macro domain-containing protein [Myxococcales bacterium]|nr:macro domain-containing protein [Myxococcales bacterium]
MTIEHGTGNLLTVDADALVNTVNCEGVMGKGLALQFKKAFPEVFASYARACKLGEVRPGKMHVVQRQTSPRVIINFPTKEQWRRPSRLEYVQGGLLDLCRTIQHLGIRSIAVPPLGCGNGGLAWSAVKSLIVEAFSGLPRVRVILFDPTDLPPTP